MPRQVFEQLAEHAQRAPARPAIVQVTPCAAQTSVSYGELQREVIAFSRALSAQSEPNEVVLLCAPNRLEFIVVYLAALNAGLNVFPLHHALTDVELLKAAQRSHASIVIAELDQRRALADRFRRAIDLSATRRAATEQSSSSKGPRISSPAMLLQTSGTTGQPKIVLRNASALDAVARNVATALRLTPDDRVLVTIPLSHAYGVENGLLAPIRAGATILLCDSFDPTVVADQFAAAGATIFPGVPFMFQVLADSASTIRAPMLRCAYSAGAPLPRAIWNRCAQRLGVNVGQLYGTTEIGSVTFGDPQSPSFDPNGVGKPMNGVETRIVDLDGNPDAAQALGDEGQIAIRAPSMLDRYVDDDTPALRDGWFLTGDLGRVDQHGNLHVTGRIKLQIDVGALKVNPLEIEQILCEHPGVRECVVVPLAVSDTLNRLKAIITLEPDGAVDESELRSFARQRLAAHKVPRVIEVRPALPKSPTGKILREALQCE